MDKKPEKQPADRPAMMSALRDLANGIEKKREEWNQKRNDANTGTFAGFKDAIERRKQKMEPK